MAPISTIVDDRLQRLYDYWLEKRGARSMPARADVDPLDLRFILGRLILVDVLREPLRFLIRVHGTELVRRSGYELTGKILDDQPTTEFRRLAIQSLTQVTTDGWPFHVFRNRFFGDRRYHYETLLLPLSKDGVVVDRILAGMCYQE